MTEVRIFAPAYNVGEHLNTLLTEFQEVAMLLRTRGMTLRVLIINDNSSDNTGAILDKAATQMSFLEVRHNETNLGNAVNIVAGYHWAAEGDIAGCLDSDGEHSPYAMLRHLRWIIDCDCDGVVGSIIFPEHNGNYHDRNMMRFHGGMQSEEAGIDGMFYIQSPGYNLHRGDQVKAALKLLPQYDAHFRDNSGEDMPRWGMHGVIIHLLAKGVGAIIKAAYLECFGQSPNRTPEKLLQQANAAMSHQMMLKSFLAGR